MLPQWPDAIFGSFAFTGVYPMASHHVVLCVLKGSHKHPVLTRPPGLVLEKHLLE